MTRFLKRKVKHHSCGRSLENNNASADVLAVHCHKLCLILLSTRRSGSEEDGRTSTLEKTSTGERIGECVSYLPTLIGYANTSLQD